MPPRALRLAGLVVFVSLTLAIRAVKYTMRVGVRRIVARGSATLDAEGKFVMTFLPEAPAESEVLYAYDVEVDVTDEGGETRSGKREYRINKATVAAALSKSAGFFSAGVAGTMKMYRADLGLSFDEGVRDSGENFSSSDCRPGSTRSSIGSAQRRAARTASGRPRCNRCMRRSSMRTRRATS